MSKGWAWVSGIAIGLCILGLLAFGQSNRQAYWAARTAKIRTVPIEQQHQPDRILIWRISR